MFPRAHIVFQYDGGTYLVYECLVLTSLLLQATSHHGLMGQDGSETLIVELYRHLWNSLPPAVYKLLHT